jgi:predicted metal-dependent hydrolase
MQIDQIIRSKRRTIALIIDREGKLIVRAPLRATQKQIRDLVGLKEEWIKSKQKLVNTTYALVKPKKYVNGEAFLYLGNYYRLEIIPEPDHPIRLSDQFYLSRERLPQAEQVFKSWYTAQAKRVISERVQWYAARYRFKVNQIRITNAQTRWGSCSPNGNLNFSWRLVMAPMQVIDYVVVHELVHLHEKNHSRRFWERVRIILPDYRKQVQWLKTYGYSLRIT